MRRVVACMIMTLSLPCVAQAQTSGVLLGVMECDYEACAQGSTLWIVREGDQVRVAAQGSGLLVPRKDGFWWLGFESGWARYGTEESDVCEVTEETEVVQEDEYESQPSVLWAARATAGGPTEWHADTLYDGTLKVNWVGTDWVSFMETTVDGREHIHLNRYLLRVPSSDSTVPRGFDLAAPELERAVADCRKLEPDEYDPPASWVVRRRATHWTLVSVQDEQYGGEEDRDGCVMPRELGAPLFGHDRVTVAWSAIKDVLPGASTAFESPSHDLLLVLQDSTLYAFIPRDGVPGKVVARSPVRGKPILAQWAVGDHARRWTGEVGALLKQGAPAKPIEP